LLPRLHGSAAVWSNALRRLLQSVHRVVSVTLHCRKPARPSNRWHPNRLAQDIAGVVRPNNVRSPAFIPMCIYGRLPLT
jgi:hypothetical protein